MSDVVLRELVDGVAVISLNRPEKHNASTTSCTAPGGRPWNGRAETDAVRVLLLRARAVVLVGPRHSELGQRAGARATSPSSPPPGRPAPGPRLPEAGDRGPEGAVIGGAFEIALPRHPDRGRRRQAGIPRDPLTGSCPTPGHRLRHDPGGPSRAKFLVMSGDVDRRPAGAGLGAGRPGRGAGRISMTRP